MSEQKKSLESTTTKFPMPKLMTQEEILEKNNFNQEKIKEITGDYTFDTSIAISEHVYKTKEESEKKLQQIQAED